MMLVITGTSDEDWMSGGEENRETNQFSVSPPSPQQPHNNRQQLSNSRQQQPPRAVQSGENFKIVKN